SSARTRAATSNHFEEADMSSRDRRPGDLGENLREGVRTVAGILGALKDAVEESFDELRARGDLSPERAREAARATMQRAQEELVQHGERLAIASRNQLHALRVVFDVLRVRLVALSHTQTRGSRPTGSGPASGETGAGGGGGGFPVDGG